MEEINNDVNRVDYFLDFKKLVQHVVVPLIQRFHIYYLCN